MKNWKSNLFVVLLVAFMLVCGFMLGRIDFRTDINDDNQSVTSDGNIVNNDTVDENDVTNDDVVIDNKIRSSEEFISLFVGKYNYEKKYEDIGCRDYMNLEIKADGTYTYSGGGNCSTGSTAKGNYSISKNKIYLFNDNCNLSDVDGECMYVNCTSLYEFNYTLVDGKVKINSGGINLEKE